MRGALRLCGVLLGFLVAAAAALPARAQDDAKPSEKPEEKPVALRLVAKTGDRLRFRLTRARAATCEILGRRGNESLSVDYDVEVTGQTPEGGLELRVVFGPAKGHFTTGDGTRLEVDTSGAYPEVEEMSAMIGMRAMTLLAGATIGATVDDRGRVIAVDGVVDAAVKVFAGTPLESLATELPAEEALKELQPYLPALPADDFGAGGEWKTEPKIDFGARLKFGFEHRWRMSAPDAGRVTLAAELVHVPGDSVPEGQVNAGEGKAAETRSTVDGFLVERTLEAAFHGEGNFDVETKFLETIERLEVPPKTEEKPAPASDE